jgi:hypothetical protein
LIAAIDPSSPGRGGPAQPKLSEKPNRLRLVAFLLVLLAGLIYAGSSVLRHLI